MTARILDISPDEYHTRPGLSASIATTLITRSPLHAWHQHPALGGKGKPPTRAQDFGTVAHAIALGKGKKFAPVPFDDYRTKAARTTRDRYRAVDLTPLLHHELTTAEEAAAAVTRELAACGIQLDGASEVAVEWEEPSVHGPVLCRCMMDHLWLEAGAILDLKFVSDAAQSAVERSAERFGYAIQAAAYTRALTALRPKLAGRVRFAFAFAENEPPYAMNLSSPAGDFREIGERRWRRAVSAWADCMNNYGEATPWPDYGRNNSISPPAWAMAREAV